MSIELGFELMDSQEVRADSRCCIIEFTVWCPRSQNASSICCFYDLEEDTLEAMPPFSMHPRTVDDVLASKACLAEAKELVLSTRDINREKN